jgi:hypothetical protein
VVITVSFAWRASDTTLACDVRKARFKLIATSYSRPRSSPKDDTCGQLQMAILPPLITSSSDEHGGAKGRSHQVNDVVSQSLIAASMTSAV